MFLMLSLSFYRPGRLSRSYPLAMVASVVEKLIVPSSLGAEVSNGLRLVLLGISFRFQCLGCMFFLYFIIDVHGGFQCLVFTCSFFFSFAAMFCAED